MRLEHVGGAARCVSYLLTAGSGNGQRVKPNQGGNDDEEGPPFSEPVMQKLSPTVSPSRRIFSNSIEKSSNSVVELKSWTNTSRLIGTVSRD